MRLKDPIVSYWLAHLLFDDSQAAQKVEYFRIASLLVEIQTIYYQKWDSRTVFHSTVMRETIRMLFS